MDKFVTVGRKKLDGSLNIQGSKNGALPILAAAYAANGESIIHNCPYLSDTICAENILNCLGCRALRQEHTVVIDSRAAQGFSITESTMREMRSSIVFLGSLLSRHGRAEVSMPGGCPIGLRPIDLHISSLQKMGMRYSEQDSRIICTVNGMLRGANIDLTFPSVGATENIILAAVTAKGTTVIQNAAREPEITDLALYLNSCGAKIYGAGRSAIRIDGVSSLHGAEHTVIPDRIVASTIMAAAAVTGGRVCLKGIIPEHIEPVLGVFRESGCTTNIQGNSLVLSAPCRLEHFKTIITRPFPGFPTDSQPIVMAMACTAKGTSVIMERIFENRFKHIPALISMGAKITMYDSKVAVIRGVQRLRGADVMAEDLRGGGALIIAGLCAEGVTQISGTSHIDRGFERIEDSLQALGAQIIRMN